MYGTELAIGYNIQWQRVYKTELAVDYNRLWQHSTYNTELVINSSRQWQRVYNTELAMDYNYTRRMIRSRIDSSRQQRQQQDMDV